MTGIVLVQKKFMLVQIIIGLLVLSGAKAVMGQPEFCRQDIFPMLNHGFAAMRASDDDLARSEFQKVIKIDPYNSYALNNLAVLAEKQGKLKEAMAYLLEAETYAAEYLHKTEEICEVGGLCSWVAPITDKGKTSSIASIIHNNIDRLRVKIGKAKN